MARLDDAALEWRRRYFTGPLSLGPARRGGLVPRIPPDPAGGELYVGEDGRVRSTANPYRVGRPEKAREAARSPGWAAAARPLELHESDRSSIALVTFREVVRRKVQVSLLFFGGLLIVAAYIASGLTIGEWHRIISDVGLSAMQLIGILIAVFLGASLISGDIEGRVLQPVVAKPVSRSQYLIGRYLGLAASSP